jgi:hypothetical protein
MWKFEYKVEYRKWDTFINLNIYGSQGIPLNKILIQTYRIKFLIKYLKTNSMASKKIHKIIKQLWHVNHYVS